MARGRFNKILEFIGLVDDEPETGFDQQGMGAQVYTPQQRRPADSARPVRQQAGYGQGGYAQGPYSQGAYAQSPYGQPSAAPRDFDRYGTRAADVRPYRSGAASDYRSSRVDQDPVRPEPRAPRTDYGRASQPYRAGATAAAPAYRSDPIRDEFERIEQPQPQQQPRGAGNVITMHNDSRHQTVIYYLHTLEECREVITDLIDGKTVLLNLEEMDEKTIQRGIDTLCGAAFALNATLRKASDKTYLIAPTNVEVALTNDVERRF